LNDDPNKLRDTLRGASDGLLLAIREVDARERVKRGVQPGHPNFADLARDVRIAAEAVLILARQEESAATKTSDEGKGIGLPTINESTPPEDLSVILAQWRRVERDLNAAEPNSPEAVRLMKEFEVLRDRYAQALADLRKKD
jgi:hypothetical protein